MACSIVIDLWNNEETTLTEVQAEAEAAAQWERLGIDPNAGYE